jgi:TonB family protein
MNAIARITFVLAIACAAPAHAQSLLFVKYENRFLPVRSVRDAVAQVKINNRFVPTESVDFVLKKTLFYRDGFIKVARFQVERDSDDNNNFALTDRGMECTVSGQLTSDRNLENCFMVLELSGSKIRGVAVFELPNLPAGKTKDFQFKITAGDAMQDGKYQLHLFSEQGEHLHSLKTSARATETTMTESYFLEKTSQRALTPVFQIAPNYPEHLKAKNVDGKATIACRIGVTGEVLETTMLDASQPEFGAAAAEAAKQWFFIPTVSEHKYIETKVAIPFSFVAPAATAAKD